MKKRSKHPEDMTREELVDATKEFDKHFAFLKGRPLTQAERAQERRLRRGRPRLGKGARKISISIETDLLKQTDAYAKKAGLNRSRLITDFLVSGLARRAS